MTGSSTSWVNRLWQVLRLLLIKEKAKADLPAGARVVVKELGSGYTTPQPPAGLQESRDIAHLHPILKTRYVALKADFNAITGHELFETCTWRSSKKQQELYQIGRRGRPNERPVTNIDGVTVKSRHNVYPSQAVDVCVDVDPGPGKKAAWDSPRYAQLGPLARKHGLIWGGSWARFRDEPHLELPAADTLREA